MPKEEKDVKPVIKFPPISKSWARSVVYQVGESTTQERNVSNQNDQGHVNIKVKGQDGSEVLFRIKRNMPLKTLMTAYCDQRAVAYNTFVFLYDGRRIDEYKTPGQLNMEEDDEIDAMLHQTGGTAV